MKIWLTAPYDDEGIEEIETLEDPIGDNFTYKQNGFFHQTRGWYSEGKTWHRTYEAAVKAANAWRAIRLQNVTKEAARIATLKPISATGAA